MKKKLIKKTRRQLLLDSVNLSAYLSVPGLFNYAMGKEALAQQVTNTGKRLVWINMSGGWDILEATEPKAASTSGIDVIHDWSEANTIAGGTEKIGRWLPNIASIGDDLLVVRGIAMGTTSHDAGSTYMNTGILSNTGDVNAASIPAIIASESNATIPIIQLNGGSEVMIDRGLLNPVSVVRASNLGLYQRMYPEDETELNQKLSILNILKSSLSRYESTVGANDRFSELSAAEEKVRNQFVNDVGANLQVTDEDRSPFGTIPNGVNRNMLDSFALTLKLIKNDLITAINLGIGGFDTHSNQSARLQPILTNVDFYISSFVSALRDINELDKTVIVLYSDFGRTPKINGSNGRDHWPVGGAMLIGGGIDGGRVVGGTDDDLRAISINSETGSLEENGTQISPIHVGGSVIELILGQSYLEYRPYLEGLPALTRLKTS